jgi:hypothetical protein
LGNSLPTEIESPDWTERSENIIKNQHEEKTMDIDELRAKVLKKREELEKAVFIADGHVVINVAYEYNIPLERCDTLEKILSWSVHLCEKTWMTLEILERFVYVAAKAHGLKVPNA